MDSSRPVGRVGELLGSPPGPPAVVERFRIAGRTVEIRFASGSLAELLTRALRHLRFGSSDTPDLVVDAWSVEGGPTTARPAGWAGDGLALLEEGSIQLAWEPKGGPLVVYDRDRRRAWMRFGPVDSVASWEFAAPFRTLLHWWASGHSMQLVHAAGVGDADGGVLLVGRGGSGKSTTALACLLGGLGYVGDDYCLVEGGAIPRVHGLYLSAKGHRRTAELLPELRRPMSSARLTEEGKSVLFADEIVPTSVRTGFPLVGIVVPRISGSESTRVQPIPAAESLRALAPSTLLQLPGNRPSGLARLAGIVRSVPSWRLELSDRPAEAVEVLARLIGCARPASEFPANANAHQPGTSSVPCPN